MCYLHYCGEQHDAHVREWFMWTVMALVLFNPDKSEGSIERAIKIVKKELREGKIDDHAATPKPAQY
jgi:hypothetical protein